MDSTQIKNELKNNYELVFKNLGIEYEIIGDNLYSTCPVHDHSDNPRALSYSINRGYWKCWTRNCQEEHKSDIFGLIGGILSKQRGQDVGFKDIIDWSCSILNISQTKKRPTKTIEKIHSEYDDILNIVNIFSNNETQQQNKVAINISKSSTSSYFIDRGFDKNTLDYFGVCEKTEITPMKDRAVIPIHDDCGKDVVGLIGRSVKEYKIPKYLIYPQGFDKKFYLYNYHRAIQRAKETFSLFVVEGQGDVWRLYEAGVYNAISIFGKDITKEQEEKICKMPVTNLIILTDNDQAGRESKIQIKRQFSRSHNVIFPKMQAKDIGEMSVEDIKSKILCNLKGLY